MKKIYVLMALRIPKNAKCASNLVKWVLIGFFFLITGSAGGQDLPIKPARTISFTTTEGSYMDVDISPDGRTILFDLTGDLYTMPVHGGNATQLTKGLAVNRYPIWSPNGKLIAYVSDASGSCHIHIRNVSGTFDRVLAPSDPQLSKGYRTSISWSPDGKYISDGQQLYCITGGKNIFPPDLRKENVQFSANPKFIYCSDNTNIFKVDNPGVFNMIYNTNKGSRLELVNKIKFGSNLVISPDGHWLTFITDSSANRPEQRDIIIRDLVSGQERVLVHAIDEHWDFNGGFSPFSLHYAFSPDSKILYNSYGGKIHSVDISTGKNAIISFSAKVKAGMGTFNYNTFNVPKAALEAKYIRSTVRSPNGKQIAFSALNHIYVMDLPDEKPRVLARQHGSQFQPSYSPDGKWIAFVSWTDTSGGAVWRIRTNGGTPELLSRIDKRQHYYLFPVWSPNGESLVTIKQDVISTNSTEYGGKAQLELISLSGDSAKIISENVDPYTKPTFSQNGQSVNYQPTITTQERKERIYRQLVSFNAKDKTLTTIATSVYRDNQNGMDHLRQIQLSPDGRFIVYMLHENLYLVQLCPLTGEPSKLIAPQEDIPLICFASGVDPHWENGGATLCWTYANRFFCVNPNKIVAATLSNIQKKVVNRLPESGAILSFVTPDQIIEMKVKAPRLYGKGIVALRDIRIISMRGNEVIEHGVVVIQDGRFTALGSKDKIKIPKGAKIIDLPGKTIIPGLIDMHDHFALGDVTPDIIPQQFWKYLPDLSYGITTARNPSAGYLEFGYSELTETGEMLGPRVYSSGKAVYEGDSEQNIKSLAEARVIVKQRVAMGGTFVKQYTLPTRQQREWLLIACREAGLNMTNEGAFDPFEKLAMIKDGSTMMEHHYTWGDNNSDMLKLGDFAKTFTTPTLQLMPVNSDASIGGRYFHYYYRHHPDSKLAKFSPGDAAAILKEKSPKDTLNPDFLEYSKLDALFRHNGQRILLGSHGNDRGIGAHFELWALQMGGLSNLEALQAATILGAEGIGVQKDLGSIERGKIADLIILDKNPLEDIHNSLTIKYVMKSGVLYNGDTLDEIWPVAKKLPEWRLVREQPLKK